MIPFSFYCLNQNFQYREFDLFFSSLIVIIISFVMIILFAYI